MFKKKNVLLNNIPIFIQIFNDSKKDNTLIWY